MEITFGAHGLATAVCFVLALVFGFGVSKCVQRATTLEASGDPFGGYIVGAILTGASTVFFMIHTGIAVSGIIMPMIGK